MEQYEDSEPKDLSMRCIKRLKPIPPPLNLGENSSALKEFAIIATSPKSPLMQKNLPFRKRAHSLSGTNDIRTVPFTTVKSPLSTSTSQPQNNKIEESVCTSKNAPQIATPEVMETTSLYDNQGLIHPVKSEREASVVFESSNLINLQTYNTCSPSPSPTLGHVNIPTISSVLMSPVGSSREELNSSQNMFPWPAPVWHCFQPGTYIKLDYPSGANHTFGMFRLAEEHRSFDWIGALQVELVEEDHSALRVCIQFCCLGTTAFITAQCHSLHTFFVKDKGWCAVYPDQVALSYQVVCQQLERGDICYPPQSMSPDLCDRFKRFSFRPEEVTVPTPFILSPPSSPCKKTSDSDRPKRPMNAFMLFAKRYRLELIQMHPGKDNRAISVLLGEAWRKLPPAQKEEYVLEARAMAQEQKRLHPDCWKRKRSHSTS